MKKSKAVPLLLLGTLGVLAGCGQDPDVETRQNNYRSIEDCQRDWGSDPRNCKAGSGGGAGAYVGPRYFYNHSGGYPVAIDSDGSTRALSNSYISRGGTSTAVGSTTSIARGGSYGGGVSRGGFGGTAHGFSSGG